jgi:hypothetical protein
MSFRALTGTLEIGIKRWTPSFVTADGGGQTFVPVSWTGYLLMAGSSTQGLILSTE